MGNACGMSAVPLVRLFQLMRPTVQLKDDLYSRIMQYTHTHARALNGPFPGLPGWAGTSKVKPIWILLKQETVSGSGISWAVCKSAPCSRQKTMPAPHHSNFYRPDTLPAAQQSKHCRSMRYVPVYVYGGHCSRGIGSIFSCVRQWSKRTVVGATNAKVSRDTDWLHSNK